MQQSFVDIFQLSIMHLFRAFHEARDATIPRNLRSSRWEISRWEILSIPPGLKSTTDVPLALATMPISKNSNPTWWMSIYRKSHGGIRRPQIVMSRKHLRPSMEILSWCGKPRTFFLCVPTTALFFYRNCRELYLGRKAVSPRALVIE